VAEGAPEDNVPGGQPATNNGATRLGGNIAGVAASKPEIDRDGNPSLEVRHSPGADFPVRPGIVDFQLLGWNTLDAEGGDFLWWNMCGPCGSCPDLPADEASEVPRRDPIEPPGKSPPTLMGVVDGSR